MFKTLFQKLWQEAYRFNDQNILSLLKFDQKATVLDLGCGDGQKTILYQKKIGTKLMVGADGVRARLQAAKVRGVTQTVSLNIESEWPLPDKYFDAVISNQVIEHIFDIDHFLTESYRILKPGGYMVVSTENLASWHNIFALVLGWQDFSHHILKISHVTNPLSPHFEKKTASWSKEDNSSVDDSAYPHIKILTYKSLIKIFQAYNFIFEKGGGAGYYPLFGNFSRIISKFDPIHSHFISARFKKPI